MYLWVCVSNDVLIHHGIKGQRWGVRRFQNEDGGLTPRGRARYEDGSVNSRVQQPPRSHKSHINKKHVAIGAAVVAGSALAVYGATHYKKLANARKVVPKVSKADIPRVRIPKTEVGRTTVSRTTTSVARKATSSAKFASKPILSLGGHDTGFTQADMDKMLDNLGKMSDIAKKGQDVLRNL